MKSSVFCVVSFAVLASSLLLPGFASALVSSVLYIQGPGGSVLVNTTLSVPETCTVQDSAGASHTFSGHKAICALQVAKDTGVITGFQVTDAGFGFSLDSVNGIANAPGWVEFWHLWQNGALADVGIQGIVLSEGDDFQLTYGPWVTGIISAPQQVPGGSVVTDIYPRRIAVEEAVSFLVAHQKEDGSWGHPLFTDWVAVALGAYKGNSTSAFYAKNELVQWLKGNPIPVGSALTDFERRAMALMALGMNPYSGTGVDYIQAIVREFDGTQFGNMDLVNDDIFALLALAKAGYPKDADPVESALQFVLDSQRENGSWGDADMSAAAIQVLDLFPSSQERDEAIAKAKEYLEGKQESTGGFGNVYSTSWVLQAIAAMQENGDSWVIDDRTPEHFLALRQAPDGGLLEQESRENRIWATSYAIPAALGKSWGSILSTFEKSLALLPKEDSSVPSIAQKDDTEVRTSIIESMKQQIAVLQKEIAVLRKLEQVQVELDRIALEVKAVQVKVVAFKVQQLAQNLGQPRTDSLAQAQEPIAVSPATPMVPSQAPSQDLSGITLAPEDKAAPLAAEAKEAAGAQGLSPQLIILLVIIGGALFAFSGGMNALAPFLRKTFSRV